MRTWLTLLILLGGAGYWASTGLVAVDETEFVIVKQFGRPVRTVLTPGLQWKWPAPFQRVVRFDNRLQVFEDPAADAPAKEYLTGDKKNVEVATVTYWRIAPDAAAILRFLETVRDHDGAAVRLGDMVKNQLNAALGSTNFDALIGTDPAQRRWGGVLAAVHDACRTAARDTFGIDIVDLRILRLGFPPQNRRSVFDRMQAERSRIATQYRSEGDAASRRIKAEALAEQERILAAARAEAEQIKGTADAEATRIYGDAYSTDPDFYQLLRTLEAYEKGLDEETTLILPAESPFFRFLVDPDIRLDDLGPRLDQFTHDDDADANIPES